MRLAFSSRASLAVLAVAAVLLVAHVVPEAARPAGAVVTFGGGYDLGSDNGNPYTDGSEGVSALFKLNGDFVLGLGNSTRKFKGTYTFVGCPFGAANCGQVPGTSSFISGILLNVHDIGDMRPGTVRWTQAAFNIGVGPLSRSGSYSLVWQFGWCGIGTGPDGVTTVPESGCSGHTADGSQMVSVARTDPGGGSTPMFTVDTGLVSNFVTSNPGPVSELREQVKSGWTMNGLYRTSFRLTITCLNGCGVFAQ